MDKPREIIELENIYGIKLREVKFYLDYKIRDKNSFICNYKREVIALNLNDNNIKEIKSIKLFTKLEYLDLSDNQISDFQILNFLFNLKELNLSCNKITKVNKLDKLTKLQTLDLGSNQIIDIKGIESLIQLNELYLYGNKIADIRGLDSLSKLKILNLNTNLISEIIALNDVLNLNSLIYLNIIGNPFIEKCGLIINVNENHLDTIKNELRKIEDEKEAFKLPIKISLLGNHASGKSTFLEYFKSGTIVGGNSTHILNVEMIGNDDFPEAVFFDFGGQDYYHGIYKAFLTNASLNMLFWQPETDVNKIQEQDSKGYRNINFNRNYWLGQIDYIEDIVFPKKENEEINAKNIYQIQTHADKQNSEQNILQNHRTKRFYYISLDSEKVEKGKFKHDVAALKEEIKELIENRKEEKKSVNEIKLYEHILETKKTDNKVEVKSLLNSYNKKEDEINLLKAELDQLSKKGFVLYYKNCPALENVVWLDINKTAKEIHDKFDDDFLRENKGEIRKDKLDEKVNDSHIIELLKHNKVIFLDEKRKGKIQPTYIVPSYLPYSINEEEEYFMFKSQKCDITLKFIDFIPFGFMNQLICKYGGENEVKIYRKNKLLFTLADKKVEILIILDFIKLTIGIRFFNLENNVNKKEIEKKIFTDLLGIYNDKVELKKDSSETDEKYNSGEFSIDTEWLINTENIPKDLYISLDSINFIHYKTLEDKEITKNEILAYPLNEQSQIVKEKARTISTYPFKNISFNPNLKQMKKIFISYSRQDVYFKDELKKYLNFINLFGIADNWSCDEIKIGNWNEQIQKELKEADLVIMMMSIDFFSSRYILDKEILESIQQIENGANKKIYPIKVKHIPDLDNLIKRKQNESALISAFEKVTQHQYGVYDKELNPDELPAESLFTLNEFLQKGKLDFALSKIVDKIVSEL